MEIPAPASLIEAIRRLPGGSLTLDRLRARPGVHLVGGAPRDLLLGRTPRELDLVAESDVAALAALLGGVVRPYDRFGTCTVTVDGLTLDLAQARRETYARPGALPEVEPAALADDLLRRDFTVNAIAIALGGQHAGQITAAPRALDDLEAGLLRVLHDASFRDDPTRLLRLARYQARLQFDIEPHTGALVRAAVDDHALREVSGVRIGNELRLLAREGDPVAAFAGLHSLGLAAEITPSLHAPDPDVAGRALVLAPADARRDLLVLGLAEPGDADELDRLGFDAGDRKAILEVAAAPQLSARLVVAKRPSEIAAAVGGAGPEAVAAAGALGAREAAQAWLDRLRHIRLEIGGTDLIDAGVPPGPDLGKGLRAALAAKLDGRAADRRQELAEAVRAATASG